jgi:pyridoxine 5-phosphate synthase
MVVALFIDPEASQVEAAKASTAKAIEFHTGAYAHAKDKMKELTRLRDASKLAASLGLEVHAGHGLTFNNVEDVAAIPEICELNIGHFLIGEAVFTGLEEAVAEMKRRMLNARKRKAA